jgi:hypothetical protein
MTVYMYDGINSLAAGIAREFPHATKIAGYDNGYYAWTQAEWDLFPHADHIHISVTASASTGDVLDVEIGDATPDQTHGWISMRKSAGLFRPTIYCSLGTVPAVRNGTREYILGKDYDIWVARYDGSTLNVYTGTVAKQYAALTDYDLSVVYDTNWPYRKAPAPPQPTSGWPANVVLVHGNKGEAVRALQQALHDTGIYGVRGIAVDGAFGGQTLTAVRNFQTAKSLAVDGVAGPATRTALGFK